MLWHKYGKKVTVRCQQNVIREAEAHYTLDLWRSFGAVDWEMCFIFACNHNYLIS